MFYVLQISFTNNCMYSSCTYKLAHQHQVAPRTAKLGHWNGPHRHRGHDGNPWYSFLIFAVFCIDCAHIEFNHEQFIIMNSWMLVWTIINTNHPFISKKPVINLKQFLQNTFRLLLTQGKAAQSNYSENVKHRWPAAIKTIFAKETYINKKNKLFQYNSKWVYLKRWSRQRRLNFLQLESEPVPDHVHF